MYDSYMYSGWVVVGGISVDVVRAGSRLREAGHELLPDLTSSTGHHDVRAVACSGGSDGSAETLRPAADQDDLAVQQAVGELWHRAAPGGVGSSDT